MIKIKLLLLLAVTLVGFQTYGQVQEIKNPSKEGLSLRETSISEVKQLDPGLKEVKVEEMDLPNGCFGESGKKYYTSRYPGVIFQKERNSDVVSKIRLTKKFKGKLPDGKSIDMQNLQLQEVFRMYPSLKDQWGSRDCSNFLIFSNDTLVFYVKKDMAKKPQFPSDEGYYLQQPITAIDVIVSCDSFVKENKLNLTKTPTGIVVFLDSVRVSNTLLNKFDAKQIASVSIYKDETAIEKLGLEAVDGLIYLETKVFAKKRYWNFLKSKSKAYSKLVPKPAEDDEVVYILNGKVLKENFEGDLARINEESFINLKLISSKKLKTDFQLSNKKGGVMITSKKIEKEK